MCNKRNTAKIIWRYGEDKGEVRVDECIHNLINFINRETKFLTFGCCCGHGRYPLTIVACHIKKDIDEKGMVTRFRELISNKIILRSRKIYKKDKEGYYYIPETLGIPK